MSILWTLIVLTIIIFIHELGHFLSAKYFDIPVSEFAIGMGPKVLSKKGEYTEYSLRAIPIGGFVNIEGMEPGSDVEDGFNKKAPYKRFIVLFAGVFMNFVLAFLIMFFMVIIQGEYQQSEKPIIGEVTENSHAKGKIKTGDLVLSIEEKEVNSWDDVVSILSKKEDPEISLKVQRNQEILSINTRMQYENDQKRYYLGIVPEYEKVNYGIIEGAKVSVERYYGLFAATFQGFKMLIRGEVTKEQISGPVGTVKIVDQFAKQGIAPLLFLTALLSINIGIINLFPLPALDGGRIVFVVLEKLGIKINKEIEEKVHKVGFILLITLIIVITYNDILNLIN
ncbi:MAG: RIP metalloprotease RseP [Fusobacteriota bacterium]